MKQVKEIFLMVSLLIGLPLTTYGAESKRILVTGSSTIAPLMLEISKEFEKKTGFRIDVQTGGSSRVHWHLSQILF